MIKKEWFRTGFSGVDDALEYSERVREERERRRQLPFRFRLKRGESAKIVFLSGAPDEPFEYWEHNIPYGGRWDNYFVCLSKNGIVDEYGKPLSCGFDELYNPYYVGLFSIIDLRGFTKKDGTKINYSLKILPAKISLLDKLRRQASPEKRGNLKGCVFEITRGRDDRSLATGDDLEFIEKLTEEQLKERFPDCKPINFRELIVPPTPEQIAEIMVKKKEFDDAEESVDIDSDIPF